MILYSLPANIPDFNTNAQFSICNKSSQKEHQHDTNKTHFNRSSRNIIKNQSKKKNTKNKNKDENNGIINLIYKQNKTWYNKSKKKHSAHQDCPHKKMTKAIILSVNTFFRNECYKRLTARNDSCVLIIDETSQGILGERNEKASSIW